MTKLEFNELMNETRNEATKLIKKFKSYKNKYYFKKEIINLLEEVNNMCVLAQATQISNEGEE